MAITPYKKSREEWKDNKSGGTAIYAENMNHIEQGIFDNSYNMYRYGLGEAYQRDRISVGSNNNGATGLYSQAFGYDNKSTGVYANTIGANNEASGIGSHAEGFGNKASGQYQHVQGRFNIEDTNNQYAHIVGGGTPYGDRKNIHTLDWEGNAEFAGDVTDGNGTSIAYLLSRIEELEKKIEALESAT